MHQKMKMSNVHRNHTNEEMEFSKGTIIVNEILIVQSEVC